MRRMPPRTRTHLIDGYPTAPRGPEYLACGGIPAGEAALSRKFGCAMCVAPAARRTSGGAAGRASVASRLGVDVLMNLVGADRQEGVRARRRRAAAAGRWSGSCLRGRHHAHTAEHMCLATAERRLQPSACRVRQAAQACDIPLLVPRRRLSCGIVGSTADSPTRRPPSAWPPDAAQGAETCIERAMAELLANRTSQLLGRS